MALRKQLERKEKKRALSRFYISNPAVYMKVGHGGLVHLIPDRPIHWKGHEHYIAAYPQLLRCGEVVMVLTKVDQGEAVTCMGCVA